MATIINARDVLLQAATPRLIGWSLGTHVDFLGTLNGEPVQDVIDAAYASGGGDVTEEILENSGTTITVTSSVLFEMLGAGLGGTFIGGGGIFGKNSAGVTKFSLSSSTGLLTAEDAIISGTLQAGSIITSSVTLSGSGRTLAMIDAGATGYDAVALQADLDAGVSKILAGVGSNYRLNVDTTNAFVTLQHKDAVYNGIAAIGSNKPALGISAAGIAMGYNRSSDGQWVNAVAIDSTGNATFAGTVAANSIVAQNVLVSGTSTTMIDLVNGIGGTFDLQSALDAGVENILAGIGSNYRLDVDTAAGYVVFRHQDAVYQGTAAAGSVKPALGISAAGIAMGHNRASDGQWVNSVAIDATGNATFAGTVAANSIIANSATVNGVTLGTIQNNAATGSSHASSTGNVHNVSLTQISGDLDDIANGSTYFKTTSTQVTGAARAANALDSSSDYIRSLVSTKMSLVGSNPSTGIVMDGNGIRMYQASSLKVNIPVSGDPSFTGNIIGGSDINISGQAIFSGNNTVGGITAAMHVNDSLASANGIVARSSSGIAIQGLGQSTNGDGLYGQASGSGGAGVAAVHTGGGVALAVSGRMTISNTTLVSNLNADMVDGNHSTAFCRTIGSHGGTATVSSSHFNILCTVANVTTTGGGSNITIAPSSDERLKFDIEPEQLGLDFICSLNPVTFRRHDRPSRILYHGFVAQHVGKLLNREDDCFFLKNDDGYYGTDYAALTSPMALAIKQLNDKIKVLEQMIENLK